MFLMFCNYSGITSLKLNIPTFSHPPAPRWTIIPDAPRRFHCTLVLSMIVLLFVGELLRWHALQAHKSVVQPPHGDLYYRHAFGVLPTLGLEMRTKVLLIKPYTPRFLMNQKPAPPRMELAIGMNSKARILPSIFCLYLAS